MSNLAVHVTARFFGQVVEDTVAPYGTSVVLGGSDAMALPKPDGKPHLARLTWRGPAEVAVVDADGRAHLLTPADNLMLEQGPISLELRIVRQFRLRRMADAATVVASLTGVFLLAIVIGGMSLVPSQAMTLRQACQNSWLNGRIGVCTTQQGGGGGAGMVGSDRTAEYLERILQGDFEGEDGGQLASNREATADGDQDRDSKHFFIPAGDEGPKHTMGGAKETALRPIRTAPVPKEPEEAKARKPRNLDLVAPENVGERVNLPGLQEDDDALVEDEGEDDEPVEADTPDERAEEEEGWGVRDWYDQDDARRDSIRIDAMKTLAKRILRIDPNDAEALSMLAYYQYLNEDLDAAVETYDKLIEQDPEGAAGFNNKALIFKRRGEYEEEERLYRVALTLEPGDTTALNNLAVNLAHQGRHDEALEIMHQLEILDPGEPYADLHRAKIHADRGDDDKALFYLEKALQGMAALDTLHHIEFRQDIRVDPSFAALRKTSRFRSILWRYYGDDSPLAGGRDR